MRLSYSAEAVRDIYEAHIFGTFTFGATQADKYIDRLRSTIDFLLEFPLIARERPNTRPPVRLYPYIAHNIIYRLTDDELLVVRVLHHSANWQALL